MQAKLNRKWRPRLWTVVLLVLGIVLCLPIAGLILFRFYDNQLVQQTEESLLTQAAVMSATYAELYADAAGLEPPNWGAVSLDNAVFPVTVDQQRHGSASAPGCHTNEIVYWRGLPDRRNTADTHCQCGTGANSGRLPVS